jgi:hypothetical protein
MLSIAVMAQLIFLWRNSSKRYKLFLLVQIMLLAVILELGSYRVSPLFSDTKILRGFNVTVRDRPDVKIESGEIVIIGKDSPPLADYDVLRLSMRSSCGFSAAVGEIKFSILP